MKIKNIVEEICELYKGEIFIGYITSGLQLNDVLIQIKELKCEDNQYHLFIRKKVKKYPILKNGRVKNFPFYHLIDKQIRSLMGF
jgi:hypothetical protein